MASPDYGIFSDLVKMVGFLSSAAFGITLTWRGRARWEPSEEDIPRGPQRVAGLLNAILLAVLWSQLGGHEHWNTLLKVTLTSGVVCLISLLIYGFLVSVCTYQGEPAPGPRKLIGGFWPLPSVKRATRGKGGPRTVQELLARDGYDPDRIWPRWDRAIAKVMFVVAYLGLVVAGTVALASASMLTLYKDRPAPTDRRALHVAIVLSGEIYFTRDVMGAFCQKLDSLLAGTTYYANYEFTTIEPDASKSQNNESLLRELLARFPDGHPDYLVTVGTQASELAARSYLNRIPIVFVAVTDPIRSGLVKSFSPDPRRGNIAGVVYWAPIAEYVNFFKRAFPDKKFGFVFNRNYPQDVYLRDTVLTVAPQMHMMVVPIEVREPRLSLKQQEQADIFFGRYYVGKNIVSFVTSSSKPFVAGDLSNVTKGAIACIAPSSGELGELAAEQVLVKNLLENRPLAELPIVGPRRFQTAVSTSAARKYGVTISADVMREATRRID